MLAVISAASRSQLTPAGTSSAAARNCWAAARNDSIRRVEEAANLTRTSARRAASAMLSNPDALRAFERGATRMGGPLNTRRRGDLQTQIDALTPYLTNVGLSYDQFKAVVAESGVGLFDEFGRMLPDALRQFASGN